MLGEHDHYPREPPIGAARTVEHKKWCSTVLGRGHIGGIGRAERSHPPRHITGGRSKAGAWKSPWVDHEEQAAGREAECGLGNGAGRGLLITRSSAS